MKRLYYCDKSIVQMITVPFKICEEKPTIMRAYRCQRLSIKKVIENVYWYLISKGRYRVWCVFDKGKVIHTSYVIPKCIKFPFLRYNNEYEIGPCFTETEYRGKSIYPAVLVQILSFLGGVAYIIIDNNNIPSIRGASKAGFIALPGEIKVDRFKRYVYSMK